jgi:hypothetical protein
MLEIMKSPTSILRDQMAGLKSRQQRSFVRFLANATVPSMALLRAAASRQKGRLRQHMGGVKMLGASRGADMIYVKSGLTQAVPDVAGSGTH